MPKYGSTSYVLMLKSTWWRSTQSLSVRQSPGEKVIKGGGLMPCCVLKQDILTQKKTIIYGTSLDK